MSDLSGPSDEDLAVLFVRARRTAARIVGDGEAEDVAAETICRLLPRWTTVHSYAERWVVVAAGNRAIDVLRRRRRHGIPPDSASFEDALVGRLTVGGLLGRLPARQREALTLRYLAGLSEAEVAAALGVTTETARTHLRRGRAAIRRDTDREELRP